jgi:hypothetical protein
VPAFLDHLVSGAAVLRRELAALTR